MIKYEQLSIYYYLDYEDDELYELIHNLKIGEEMLFNETKISRHQQHYEVENDEFHEIAKAAKDCYDWLLVEII